ncbi:MAG: hypothetical protein Q9216_007206 [Gyalolechia sp. 2 TL-2023]
MRALILSAVLLNAHLSLAHFSLSELQPIAGFSDACTQAYESPFTACTISDFYVGATCSAQCIAYLEAFTKLINDECRGITALPNTLIGLFFQRKAIEKLCPNVGVTTVTPAGAGQGSSLGSTAGSTESVAAFTQVSATRATPTQISIQITSTTSKVETTTAASSTRSTSAVPSTSLTTTPVVVVSSATPSGSSVDVGSASSSFPLTGVTSSSGAEQANPTAGSQRNSGGAEGDNNGDGGTVLDAASKADRGARASTWLWLVTPILIVAVRCV